MEVKDLPEAAKKALEEAGIDLAAAICVDKQGKTHMLKGSGVNGRDTNFPITTTAIEEITSTSMVRYKGSHCITIVIGGSPHTYCWP